MIEKGYTVYSVEQEQKWINYCGEKGNCLLAPLVYYAEFGEWWYDITELKKEISSDYGLIIIDGPTGPNKKEYNRVRLGFYYHRHLFNLDVPILIDDTVRVYEKELLLLLNSELKRPTTELGKCTLIEYD
jgi:hypothetical protein